MIKFILFLLLVLFGGLTIAVGLVNYKYRQGENRDIENFSFLNQFPYEMQGENDMKYSLLVRLFATLFSLTFAVFGLMTFWLHDTGEYKPFSDYFISVIFLLLACSFISEFIITLKNYKIHLLSSSVVFGGTVVSYIFIGVYLLLRPDSEMFHASLAYVLLIIGAVLLLSLIIAPLKRWMYLEKEEKNGVITYHRKHLSILPFMEWIFIFANIVLVALLTFFSK